MFRLLHIDCWEESGLAVSLPPGTNSNRPGLSTPENRSAHPMMEPPDFASLQSIDGIHPLEVFFQGRPERTYDNFFI